MKYLWVVFTLLAISGCAVFDSKYSCGTIPNAGCTPLSDVYENTSGEVYDYRQDSNSESRKSLISQNIIKVSPSTRALNYVNPGDPILTQPVVMRVLYRSFETDKSDLDAGGYVYLKMRDSEWVLLQR
jgi:hypothetical protein